MLRPVIRAALDHRSRFRVVSCDSSREAVVRLIREAKLLEIGGERAKRMKHALIVHAREGGCKLFATDMERVEAMERRLTGRTAV